jgi:hypothetical protein
MPAPQGNQTPYGRASEFNPQFTSFLPQNSTAPAQIGDPSRQEFGTPTPLLEQQRAAPMVAQAPGQDLKGLLAMLMSQPKQKKRYEGSGSHGGGRG